DQGAEGAVGKGGCDGVLQRCIPVAVAAIDQDQALAAVGYQHVAVRAAQEQCLAVTAEHLYLEFRFRGCWRLGDQYPGPRERSSRTDQYGCLLQQPASARVGCKALIVHARASRDGVHLWPAMYFTVNCSGERL